MADIKLKIAIADHGHTSALKDGSVRIEGVAADFIEVAPIIAAYRRMVRDLEFDVCEAASSSTSMGSIPPRSPGWSTTRSM
jgi:4,5-dihydroxyphthalate decarboxylase